MSRPRFSTRNKGVRRIYADIKEMQDDPSDQYHAMPLDDNLFDWHFTLRGPEGTDFEGGVYHGRIVLPSEYPFKPPNIYFMNRNGRFEINKKKPGERAIKRSLCANMGKCVSLNDIESIQYCVSINTNQHKLRPFSPPAHIPRQCKFQTS